MFRIVGAATAAAWLMFLATNAAAFAYFTPLNPAPAFEVTRNEHPLGRYGIDITPLPPTGQANIKFYFSGSTDYWSNYAPALIALGGLDANLAFSAVERPFPYDKSYPTMGNIRITYAGVDALVANGKTYNPGAVLFEVTSAMGNVSQSGAYFWVSPQSDFVPTGLPWGYFFSVGLNRLTGDASQYTAALTNGSIAYGVPEPSTWAMMIIGFLGVGRALRRSRAHSPALT